MAIVKECKYSLEIGVGQETDSSLEPPGVICCRKGDPLGPESGLLSNTQKWIVRGDIHSDKAWDFIPLICTSAIWGSLVAQMVKNRCNEGHLSLIPGLGWYTGEGTGYPLQYSCLENSWTEESGGLQCMGSQRDTTEWLTLSLSFCIFYIPSILGAHHREWQQFDGC